MKTLLKSLLLLFCILTSAYSQAQQYSIENCVNELSLEKTIPTNAGYQYWFADKNFLEDGRTLKLSVVDVGKATHAPHKHPEDEFFFILEGKAEFYLDGKTKVVGPNTSLYCPSNIEHGIRNAGDKQLKYLVLKKYEVATHEQEAQQAVIKVFDALSNRDAVSLRSNCTSDVRFYEYGEAWTADSLVNKAITRNTAADFKRTNRLDFVSTTVKEDVAWITYNLNSEITSKGKNFVVHWLETVVLVREEKKWKVKVLHSTLIKKS
jgi:mannose-6-phosphate isomerase-like protein (cupin superfamily)